MNHSYLQGHLELPLLFTFTKYCLCFLSTLNLFCFEFNYLLILVAQPVKQSAMWQTGVQVLGGEDPLESGMATHSSILAWKIPWTEETGGL